MLENIILLIQIICSLVYILFFIIEILFRLIFKGKSIICNVSLIKQISCCICAYTFTLNIYQNPIGIFFLVMYIMNMLRLKDMFILRKIEKEVKDKIIEKE